MQIKIDECKAVVPKNFEEILVFFRQKLNVFNFFIIDGSRIYWLRLKIDWNFLKKERINR